jgi:hypothetical protein
MQHLRFKLQISRTRSSIACAGRSAARAANNAHVQSTARETCMHERRTEFPVNGGMLRYDESTSARECALVDPHLIESSDLLFAGVASNRLAADNEFDTPILLTPCGGVVGGHRSAFAEALCANSSWCNLLLQQVRAY